MQNQSLLAMIMLGLNFKTITAVVKTLSLEDMHYGLRKDISCLTFIVVSNFDAFSIDKRTNGPVNHLEDLLNVSQKVR